MKYSIRTLLLVLLAFAVLCAFYYRVFVLPLKADQPFATKVLENGLEIRLWAKPNFYSSVKPDISKAQTATTTSLPKTGRSLFAEIRSEDGQPIFPLCEMDVDFEGMTNSVAVAYSSDRKFAAIFSPNNPDLLILADFDNQSFVSPMTIWAEDYEAIRNEPDRLRSDLSPGPVRIHWQAILQKIQTANPGINVDSSRL